MKREWGFATTLNFENNTQPQKGEIQKHPQYNRKKIKIRHLRLWQTKDIKLNV